MCLLGEEADESGDGVITTGVGKVGDEVKTNVGPRTGGNGVGLEEARWKLSRWLGALTGGTSADVRLDGAGHMGPPVKTTGGVKGTVDTGVSTVGSIVHLVHKAETERWIIRDAEAVSSVVETISGGDEGRQLMGGGGSVERI